MRLAFEFCFFKENVLTCTRVIFFKLKFFRLLTRVFLAYIEISRVCGAFQLKQNGLTFFSHIYSPKRNQLLFLDSLVSVGGQANNGICAFAVILNARV